MLGNNDSKGDAVDETGGLPQDSTSRVEAEYSEMLARFGRDKIKGTGGGLRAWCAFLLLAWCALLLNQGSAQASTGALCMIYARGCVQWHAHSPLTPPRSAPHPLALSSQAPARPGRAQEFGWVPRIMYAAPTTVGVRLCACACVRAPGGVRQGTCARGRAPVCARQWACAWVRALVGVRQEACARGRAPGGVRLCVRASGRAPGCVRLWVCARGRAPGVVRLCARARGRAPACVRLQAEIVAAEAEYSVDNKGKA